MMMMSFPLRAALSSFFFATTYFLPLLAIAEAVRRDGAPSARQIATSGAVGFAFIAGPMSVCLHRYFAHSAFSTTTRSFRFVLAVISTFAYQGGPLWWASKHRRHHKFCDEPGDPHSPCQLGFWRAFLGWTLDPAERSVDYDFVRHIAGFWELEMLEYCWWVFPLAAHHAVRATQGPTAAAVYVAAPLLVCRLVTLLFNVEFHRHGTGTGMSSSATCRALDTARFLGDLVGESAHSHHHLHPKALLRPSLGPPFVDVPYYLCILPLLRLGLIHRIEPLRDPRGASHKE